jgi:hypothetical protein
LGGEGRCGPHAKVQHEAVQSLVVHCGRGCCGSQKLQLPTTTHQTNGIAHSASPYRTMG